MQLIITYFMSTVILIFRFFPFYLFFVCFFHQYYIISLSCVSFFLQSLSFPTSLQTDIPVCTPSTPPVDLIMEESLGHHTIEVAIPNVGTFVIEAEKGGYDDEVALAQTFYLFDVWS